MTIPETVAVVDIPIAVRAARSGVTDRAVATATRVTARAGAAEEQRSVAALAAVAALSTD